MERRRGARIPARMWIQIAGVDTKPVLRRGDVSLSGMYVETSQRIGDPGSVVAATITSYGRESSVELLVRIVRLVLVHDLWHDSEVAGIALEFLLDNLDKRQQLETVIRDVMASRSYVAESLDATAQVADQHLAAADEEEGRQGAPALERPSSVDTVPSADAASTAAPTDTIGVRVMVLETSWPAAAGEPVHCQLETPLSGRRVQLTGRVIRSTVESTEPAPRYRVEVDFAPSPADPGTVFEGRSISDAVDTLLEEVVFPLRDSRPPSRQHLRGLLERIRLPNLLAFCELEQLSGVLSLQCDNQRAQVYLRDGQVVDAELGDSGAEPRVLLAMLCRWTSGSFEFSLRDVNRLDRVGMSTSALVRLLTRQGDGV